VKYFNTVICMTELEPEDRSVLDDYLDALVCAETAETSYILKSHITPKDFRSSSSTKLYQAARFA
jgi:hypothetical protein